MELPPSDGVQPSCGQARSIGLGNALLGKAMVGRRLDEIYKVRYEEQQINREIPLLLASITPADVGDRKGPSHRAQGAAIPRDRRQAAERFPGGAIVEVGGLGQFAVAGDVRRDMEDVRGRCGDIGANTRITQDAHLPGRRPGNSGGFLVGSGPLRVVAR
jgi:hypothetical protein